MSPRENVWVVDDDDSIRWVLQRAFQKAQMNVRIFQSADLAIGALKREQPEVLISDVRMPGTDGMNLLSMMHEEYPDIPVIIMTAYSDLDSTLSAYQKGAFEYVAKPFDITEVIDLTRRACLSYREKVSQQQTLTTHKIEQSKTAIIGRSQAMQEVFRSIGKLSNSNMTVLITGESGTGKELIARTLHDNSPRKDNSFIALNTAAIPKELLESELFGHEKGAFTGAQSRREGYFEQADGGTLFLDEIGDMPADLQTRLLRVLADGCYYRVGGKTTVKVDVRIITATHQDLKERVKDGRFREDLYYRLNVINIHSPALRERTDDIPLLLNHFMQGFAKELDLPQKTFTPEVLEYLKDLEWSGNVRQLENACRWLMIMASGREIHIDDLPDDLRITDDNVPSHMNWEDMLENYANRQLESGVTKLLDITTPIYERIMIKAALKKTGGQKREAAELLGWGRNTLTRKLKLLDMN